MPFKKRETNKIRHPGRKRKIIATIALSWSILFGKTRLSFSQSSSPNFDHKVVQERIIDDQEFEDNDQQVILVRNNSSAPTIRPGLASGFSSNPRINRPARASGLKPVRAIRTPRGFITGKPVTVAQRQQTPFGKKGNSNSAGASLNDEIPKIPQEPKTCAYDYPSSAPKKKKQSAEQCELDENINERKIEIVYRIKENPALIREAERMGKDQAAQKDVNNLIEQLSLGNDNPGTDNRRVKNLKNVSEARGRNGGRVYFRKKDGKIEILAKSNKDNQKKVIGILQKMGY